MPADRFTYHTAQNDIVRERFPERIFVSDAVLDDHDGCLLLIHGWSQLFCGGCLIDRLVRTNDIVVGFLRFRWCHDHWISTISLVWYRKEE